jgi:hypothetical protein
MTHLPAQLRRLNWVLLIATVSIASAGFSAQALAAPKEVRVVQLPPVTVTARRIPVVQLERVVVTAKRGAPTSTMLAQRSARTAPV